MLARRLIRARRRRQHRGRQHGCSSHLAGPDLHMTISLRNAADAPSVSREVQDLLSGE